MATPTPQATGQQKVTTLGFLKYRPSVFLLHSYSGEIDQGSGQLSL